MEQSRWFDMVLPGQVAQLHFHSECFIELQLVLISRLMNSLLNDINQSHQF